MWHLGSWKSNLLVDWNSTWNATLSTHTKQHRCQIALTISFLFLHPLNKVHTFSSACRYGGYLDLLCGHVVDWENVLTLFFMWSTCVHLVTNMLHKNSSNRALMLVISTTCTSSWWNLVLTFSNIYLEVFSTRYLSMNSIASDKSKNYSSRRK